MTADSLLWTFFDFRHIRIRLGDAGYRALRQLVSFLRYGSVIGIWAIHRAGSLDCGVAFGATINLLL